MVFFKGGRARAGGEEEEEERHAYGVRTDEFGEVGIATGGIHIH